MTALVLFKCRNNILFTIFSLVVLTLLLSSCVASTGKTKNDIFHAYRSIPTTKAWDQSLSNPLLYVSPDDIRVSLLPLPVKPGYFTASATNPKIKFEVIFRGVCEPVMPVTVLFRDPPMQNVIQYKKTANINSLNMNKTLNTLRDVLEVQCPELTAFNIKGGLPQGKEFDAYMLAADGWKLQSGSPAGGFGAGYRVKINLTYSVFNNPSLIVQHDKECEKEPSLLIKRFYSNLTDRAFAKDLPKGEVDRFAGIVTQKYVEECPEVEAIRYQIGNHVIPQEYICNNPKECLVARKSAHWSIDNRAIDLRPSPEPRKKLCLTKVFCDYDGGDVLNAIYEGNFNHFVIVDTEYSEAGINLIKSVSQSFGGRNATSDKLHAPLPETSSIINEYLHEYQKTSSRCLRDGAETLTFERHTPDKQLVNSYGAVLETYKGVDLSASYSVNQEFISICKKVCSAGGGNNLVSKMLDDGLNNGMRNKAYGGLRKMMANEPCDSKQIKQFENNLIKFYGLSIEHTKRMMKDLYR